VIRHSGKTGRVLVLRIPVLADQASLQTTQAKIRHIVLELVDASGIVRIDRTNTPEPIGMLTDQTGDHRLGHTNAATGSPETIHDHTVAVGSRLAHRFGCRVKSVRGLPGMPGEVENWCYPQIRLHRLSSELPDFL